jgi:non-specific serine/threonine protein kinase
VREPALVASTIAQQLGVREGGTQPLIETLQEELRDQHTLLVLDNFEHLLDAAPLVTTLLTACSQLAVLVTSRSRLRLGGEHDYPVDPLALPDPSLAPPLSALAVIPSVALFVQRARAVRPEFQLTDANAATVAAICTRLDGLPLAIELAAARVKMLSPAALLARLSDRLRLLTGGPRDAPARQQTIRDAIGWSYDLLSPNEQRLFRQLSVFVGGWTLEAAEAVCDADRDAFELLSNLVDHSLVGVSEQPDGEPRYTMLETVRQYGLERLAESGEEDAARSRHLSWLLEFAQRAQTQLQGPDQRAPLVWLDAELDNVRAALTSALDHEDGATALRLAVIVVDYWGWRGSMLEGRRWLERALDGGGEAPTAVRALALTWLGRFAMELGDHAAATHALDQALVLQHEIENQAGIADVLATLGWSALYQGRYEQAHDLFEQALSIARSAGDRHLLAYLLASQSLIVTASEEYALAVALGEESLALSRASGDRRGITQALGYLGLYALWQGDVERAAHLGEECLATARELGGEWSSFATELLGYVALEREDYQQAGSLFRTSLEHVGAQQAGMGIAECLEGLAAVAGGLGAATRGATLLGAADRVRERFNTPIPPPRRERYDRTLAAVRGGLAAESLGVAWETGRLLSNVAAVQYALEPDVVPASSDAIASAVGLSKREGEVLRLLADGQSNQEIAAALFISPHTAAHHVASILNKLGLGSRAAAAAYAVRHDLV